MLRIDIDKKWRGRPCSPREQVIVNLEDGEGCLKVTIDAPFYGDPRPEGEPGPTEGLWEHEVVELFIAGADGHYLEVELGPYGHHLVLSFSGVRERSGGPHPIDFKTVVLSRTWMGTAKIPWSLVPTGPHRINATTIHGQGRRRRYLSAVALKGESPDFHQPDCFIEAELPGAPS